MISNKLEKVTFWTNKRIVPFSIGSNLGKVIKMNLKAQKSTLIGFNVCYDKEIRSLGVIAKRF